MAYKVPPKIPTFTAGPHFTRQIVAAATGIACLMFAWTSFYTVPAESQCVVLRFGRLLKTVEPGLHLKIPLGVDTKTILPDAPAIEDRVWLRHSGILEPRSGG